MKQTSIRIGFMIAAVNDLDVMSTDVGNLYLNENSKEISHAKVGSELYGIEYEGRYASIVIV